MTNYITGLGEYLQDQDPTRTWEEHLQHTLIFCRVHVHRNLWSKYRDQVAPATLRPAFLAKTYESYIRRINRLCYTYPFLTSWFRNKRKLWIVSGLVKKVSLMNRETWARTNKNTNISESSHFEDNTAVGRRRPLGSAIAA